MIVLGSLSGLRRGGPHDPESPVKRLNWQNAVWTPEAAEAFTSR